MQQRKLSIRAGTDARHTLLRWVWLMALCGAVASVGIPQAQGMEFMSGVDISALTLLEDNGATYSDNGVPGNPVEIFVDHNVNWARLRLFLEADGEFLAVQDLPYVLDLAQRIKNDAPDMKILLDFHYSDTWADPGKQFKPAAWAGQSGVTLQNTVHNYTRDVIIDFKDAGVMPDMVQIGNEISNGMIWPDGRLWQGNEEQEFNNLAALISAGINGAKAGANDTSGSPAADEPLIMIHTDKGGDYWDADYWLDNLLPKLETNGTEPDVIGVSYYPEHHYNGGAGDLDVLQGNLNHIGGTAFDVDRGFGHNMPVVIVEAGFASRFGSSTGWPEWPFENEASQRQFLEDMVAAVQNVPNDNGWGVFWWYPEAVPTPGLPGQIWKDGRFGLFDENGELLATIDEFPELPDPVPGDVDGDGDVDLDDYNVLSDNMYESVAGGVSDGDLDNNGIVNFEDFVILALHFEAAPGETLDNVPEPTFLVLLGLTALAYATRRRRNSNNTLQMQD